MNWTLEEQCREWRRFYDDLLDIVEKYGVNNAFGDGDFWVLDDNMGGATQVLYVFDIAALRKPLVAELMPLLGSKYAGWEIMVVLNVKGPNGDDVPPEGMILHGNFIEEFWDKDLLRRLFGKDFVWTDFSPFSTLQRKAT